MNQAAVLSHSGEPEAGGGAWKEVRLVRSAGAELFLRIGAVPGEIAAEVVITHGLGEHSGRYAHVAEVLAQRGLRSWVYDVRGHGRSTGRRGDAVRYEDLLGDLECICGEAHREGRPIFLMGHSMGAQITLNLLLSRQVDCAGAVIASPWLHLAFDPPRWRRWLAYAAAAILPMLRQPTLSLPEHLSRDPTHVAALADPHLTYHLVSARLYLALRKGGLAALEKAADFSTPVLLLHGGADAVTCFAATRQFFERAGSVDKQFLLYPEAVHETLNDLGREVVLQDVADWLGKRAGQS